MPNSTKNRFEVPIDVKRWLYVEDVKMILNCFPVVPNEKLVDFIASYFFTHNNGTCKAEKSDVVFSCIHYNFTKSSSEFIRLKLQLLKFIEDNTTGSNCIVLNDRFNTKYSIKSNVSVGEFFRLLSSLVNKLRAVKDFSIYTYTIVIREYLPEFLAKNYLNIGESYLITFLSMAYFKNGKFICSAPCYTLEQKNFKLMQQIMSFYYLYGDTFPDEIAYEEIPNTSFKLKGTDNEKKLQSYFDELKNLNLYNDNLQNFNGTFGTKFTKDNVSKLDFYTLCYIIFRFVMRKTYMLSLNI